jgi:transposase
MTQDLRRILRVLDGRHEEPTAAVFDSRTALSTPGSGGRAGYDGAKRRKGSKAHMAVDTLGHLLALHVTAADAQDRRRVAQLAGDVRAATGGSVELAYVDQGYTGERPAADAAKAGIELSVVKLPEAERGFVLLPRRWVAERSFAWLARFRRLARDYERLADTLRGLHFVAFAIVMLRNLMSWDT